MCPLMACRPWIVAAVGKVRVLGQTRVGAAPAPAKTASAPRPPAPNRPPIFSSERLYHVRLVLRDAWRFFDDPQPIRVMFRVTMAVQTDRSAMTDRSLGSAVRRFRVAL